MDRNFTTMVDALTAQAQERPNTIAFNYLEFASRSDSWESREIDFVQLLHMSRSTAAGLKEYAEKGDRVVLAFEPGLNFIVAFFACLYNGIIAVPSSMPTQGVANERFKAITDDCEAKVVLATKRGLKFAKDFPDLTWCAVDEMIAQPDDQTLEATVISPSDVALLQYSSGSTGAPKGVMITHANLVNQAEMLAHALDYTNKTLSVSWLPHFHDMGLLVPIIAPVCVGFQSVLMAPKDFIQKPARWLNVVSEFKATSTSAPNFAFDLCVDSISDEEAAAWDFSNLTMAGNSSEPLRASTIERFEKKFSAIGYSPSASRVGYGLAEATLLVAGAKARPKITSFDGKSLNEGKKVAPVKENASRSRRLVSCGSSHQGTSIKIRDCESGAVADDGQVGEICVSGGGVASGYWNNEALTSDVFGVNLGGELNYMRTGDLGFIYQHDLYICGRSKDTIIIRGANYHPQDIEAIVEESNPMVEASGAAAFSIDDSSQEKLVLVLQLQRNKGKITTAELELVSQQVRQKIAEEFELSVFEIVFIQRGLPKTSSGKIRRTECRRRYLEGSFSILLKSSNKRRRKAMQSDPKNTPSADKISAEFGSMVIDTIANALATDSAKINLDHSLSEFNLTGSQLFKIDQDVKSRLGIGKPIASFSEFENMHQFIDYLAAMNNDDDSVVVPIKPRKIDERFSSSGSGENESIAIVGLGCRFPGSDNPREFWQNICDGVDSVTEVPASRWDIDSTYNENPMAVGKMNTRRGGFIDDIEGFDRNFFQIPVREAIRMDPAHRLLMQVGWEAFEDAGIVPESLTGSMTGVFIGISGSDYAQLQFGDEALADAYAGVGSALTNAAGRLSYFFNLHGPSIAVDTACSSSLSAIHLACKSIQSGECSMAIAGGVNIILSPMITMSLSKAGMMSPDGTCKAFDDKANGYVRSEGVGVVLLKPLSDAIANGDSIYGVVKGSASNQDGKSSGIAAPNGAAQQEVVAAACKDANIAPSEINYVEAHGTGTAVGDPIEANALGELLNRSGDAGASCLIGSVKTNIGHAESAAGVASFIKAALIVRNRMVPPSLHFDSPNKLIPFDQYKIKVQTELSPLPELSRPAVVGVNSFGISGTNVHILLEEYAAHETPPAQSSKSLDDEYILLPVSGSSKQALQNNSAALANYITDAGSELSMLDCYHTATQRRTHLSHRLAVIGKSAEELVDNLNAFVNGNSPENVIYQQSVMPGTGPQSIVFCYSGQGSQWWAMGRELYSNEPVYRQVIDACDETLHKHTGWSILEELMRPEESSRLNETRYSQPAIFALQVALTEFLKTWNVIPSAVVGHSLGEVTAAHISGALDLEEACQLIAVRAELMQKASGTGLMISVDGSLEDVEKQLQKFSDKLEVAVINGPKSVVVSGAAEEVEKFQENLISQGINATILPVNYAFHSPLMEPFKQELIAALSTISPKPTSIPMMSTVTGQWVEGELLDAKHWGDNLRERVEFDRAIDKLVRDGNGWFVEVGPHPVLTANIIKIANAAGQTISSLPSLYRDECDRKMVSHMLAALYTSGYSVDWQARLSGGTLLKDFPLYQWDAQRLWLDGPHIEAQKRLSKHPLITFRLPAALPTWQSRMDPSLHRYLRGVSRSEKNQLSVGMFIELLFATFNEFVDEPVNGMELTGLAFSRLPGLSDDGRLPTVQTSISPSGVGRYDGEVYIQFDESEGKAEKWLKAVSTSINSAGMTLDYSQMAIDVELEKSKASEVLAASDVYTQLSGVGFICQPISQTAQEIWIGEQTILFSLNNQEFDQPSDEFYVHPLLIEALEQACRFAIGHDAAVYDLVSMDSIRVVPSTEKPAFAHARIRKADATSSSPKFAFAVDAWITDASGAILLATENVKYSAAPVTQANDMSIPNDPKEWLFDVNWVAQADALEEAELALDPGAWLVFPDAQGLANSIVEKLLQNDQRCVLVHAGDQYQKISDQEFSVALDSVEDIQRMLSDAFPKNDDLPFKGILHFWSLNGTCISTTNMDAINSDYSKGVGSVVNVIQAVAQFEYSHCPRLWCVTAQAQVVGDSSDIIQAPQAPVWGLGKSLAIEHPEFMFTRVDVSLALYESEANALFREVVGDSKSDQIAFRKEIRYEARLMSSSALESDADEALDENGQAAVHFNKRPFVLKKAESGLLNADYDHREGPSADQIELRVANVCLDQTSSEHGQNIKMQACVGKVVSIGAGVEGVELGETRMAFCTNTVKSHICVAASRTIDVANIDSPQTLLASLKSSLSLLFSMTVLAPVERKMNVLVNGADTLLGNLAVQLAKSLGATVYATIRDAGQRQKVQELRASRVLDLASHSLASDFQQLSQGRGLDLLINFAPHSDLERVSGALSARGVCVDYSTDALSVGGAPRIPANVAYFVPNVDAYYESFSDKAQELLASCVELLESGKVEPIAYDTADMNKFNIYQDVRSELQTVLDMPFALSYDEGDDDSPYRSDVTYLITGGLGGLGLSLAERMVRQGAKNILLLGRSSPSLNALDLMMKLKQQGARCESMSVDVSSFSELENVFSVIDQNWEPLGGIIHAAGILDNGLILDLDQQRFSSVFPAKVDAAWHLHTLTKDRPLDFFIMFSSLASLIGSHGQTNYSAANAFLDGLAEHRKATGLPSTSIAWGPWDEVGMAADVHNMQKLQQVGIGSIIPSKGLGLIEDLLLKGRQGAIGAIPMNWRVWSRYFPYVSRLPFFSELIDESESTGSLPRITRDLLEGLEYKAQLSKLQEAIQLAVCNALHLDVEEASIDVPLTALGMDSIISLEIKSRIESTIDITIHAKTLLRGSSIDEVAQQCLRQLFDDDAVESEDEADALDDQDALIDASEVLDKIDELSKDEVESLLNELLEKEDV